MPDIDTWIRFKEDDFFKKSVGPDHQRFADTTRSQMMLGWYQPLIKDGKLLIATGLDGAAAPAPGTAGDSSAPVSASVSEPVVHVWPRFWPVFAPEVATGRLEGDHLVAYGLVIRNVKIFSNNVYSYL